MYYESLTVALPQTPSHGNLWRTDVVHSSRPAAAGTKYNGMVPASTARRQCTKCGLNRAASSFTSERGRVCAACRKEVRKAAHRKQTVAVYGITPAEYDAILAVQGGGCGGCGRAPRRNEKFDVDHDHKLEAEGAPPRKCVRGLLCRACNRKVLPYARNNPVTLRRLADYLESPPAWRVLQ